MKPFMDDNFLLQSETAKTLYHEHAAQMPIIDYHCHLVPQQVAENKRFESITQIWLGGDHYKWRAMRSNGVEERFCTGKDTSDWEKFEKWAETVPYTFRNPLYHWTHLELKTAFGINETLNPQNARRLFDACHDQIQNAPNQQATVESEGLHHLVAEGRNIAQGGAGIADIHQRRGDRQHGDHLFDRGETRTKLSERHEHAHKGTEVERQLIGIDATVAIAQGHTEKVQNVQSDDQIG